MKKIMMIALVALVAMSAFAGGQGDGRTAGTTGRPGWMGQAVQGDVIPLILASKVTGNIVTAGSSTVFPLAEAVAKLFTQEGYRGNITIDSIGTGAGFERFAKAGETDISNASAPIKASQIEDGRKIGRFPILEFRLGTDALAICVSKSNTWLKNVTIAQLAQIFSTAEKWSDVDPTWPAQPIQRFSPGTDSGTFDYFVEHIFKKKREPILAAKNLQLSEDDNILVQGISGSPYAIGYFGYAYFVENKDKLNVLNVETVEPSQASVDAGTYPLSRPLFMYTTAAIMKAKPQVAAFLGFMLQNVNRVIRKVGYFPAPAEAMAKAKQQWLDALR